MAPPPNEKMMMRTFTARVAAPALLLVALAGVSGCGVLGETAEPAVRDESGEITESSEADVFSLQVGDCLNETTTEETAEVTSVPTVPCGDPHDSEAYAATDMPDGDYPGDQAVIDASDAFCYEQFATFVGLSYDESVYGYTGFFPTKDTWEQLDDRTLQCIVSSEEPVTDSLKGVAE